ncbi:DNA-directed RNA polymerase subunit delta [Paenibacillus sp. JX-17]|uniref:Probable DNA-directed RNA polymerase subunit delta n=1 Tax=Paenibacillus lacisoli TaxID=3064525 RepID=A0ABT9CHB3_9BACL|nr:DNA-directed RNA polymerase subunit delta [Paenibacillus sp. JX-17]MDO7908673.1 DNA-directed RNA polymerase subunit delta [Paenibacillus sp. JX-17]
MSTPLNLNMDQEKIMETPMVDLAFMVLKAANEPKYYRDLMNEVAKLRGLSEEDINDVIAQLYTEINIDGRFACVGTNLWGLKRWYPIDKSEDGLTGSKRPRIINDEDDDEEEEYHDEEETYTADDEDFDNPDEDEDEEEIFDEDEDSDVDEDVVVDDDELAEEDDDSDEDEDESLDEEDER